MSEKASEGTSQGQKPGQKPGKKLATLHDTRNWYLDRYQTVVIQRNVLAILTFLSIILMGLAVYAVATLNASKTFEPFVIEVNNLTGIVTQISRKSVEQYAASESVKRYFLVKYIQARRQYSVFSYQYDYENVVRVLSAPDVYGVFRREVDKTNPDSAVNLGRDATRIVKIKSIAFLEENKAQVRFLLRQDQKNRGNKDWHIIATIEFAFSNDLALRTEDRYINPLGFQVTGYREDEDQKI